VTSCHVGSVSTTVYPISTVTSAAALKTSILGTGYGSPSKTASAGSLQVTAAAGRISGRFEMAAAAAGVVAVAFL